MLGLSIGLVTSFVETIQTDGVGTALLWLFIMSIFAVPVISTFGLIGGLGLAHQTSAIAEARKHRDLLCFRSVALRDVSTPRPPVVRLRDDGVGNVLLGIDSFWDTGLDSPGSGSWAAVEVGFLPVPDAEIVAGQVRLAQQPSRGV